MILDLIKMTYIIEPTQFKMSTWAVVEINHKIERNPKLRDMPKADTCPTSCCLAGWAAHFQMKKEYIKQDMANWPDYCKKLLPPSFVEKKNEDFVDNLTELVFGGFWNSSLSEARFRLLLTLVPEVRDDIADLDENAALGFTREMLVYVHECRKAYPQLKELSKAENYDEECIVATLAGMGVDISRIRLSLTAST